MAQVIKNNGEFVYIRGTKTINNSFKHIGTTPKNEVHYIGATPIMKQGVKSVSVAGDTHEETGFEDELSAHDLLPDETIKTRDELLVEYEILKQTYINEGEQAKNEAKAWAEKMIAKAKDDMHTMFAESERECARLKTEALDNGYKEGYENGYKDGSDKGFNEGYTNGLRKCKDTLKQLMAILEEIPVYKEQYYKEHERQLFDLIFFIVNKITIDSLKQKDKAVISRMLKKTAKNFRNSEYVKVTLSQLDVDLMGELDLDNLRDLFKDNQHIEFEVVKDAPQGTLVVDNGSEIIDASVNTQLKMIENLGKGKFRDAP